MGRYPNVRRIDGTIAGKLFGLTLMVCVAVLLSGCQYFHNRSADFRDMLQVGGGVTMVNEELGPVPPAIGANVHLTDFVGNLGWCYFNGYSAEVDGRGLFVGREERYRTGVPFIYQAERIRQNYTDGKENYFKKDGSWSKRMVTEKYCEPLDAPGKDLTYESWDSMETKLSGSIFYLAPLMPSVVSAEGAKASPFGLFHRGWNHWENMSVELALCDPIITKVGFNVRLGFDISEAADFIVGIFTLDMYGDDMTDAEYSEYQWGYAPEAAEATDEGTEEMTGEKVASEEPPVEG